jgi:hypothetical protein
VEGGSREQRKRTENILEKKKREDQLSLYLSVSRKENGH